MHLEKERVRDDKEVFAVRGGELRPEEASTPGQSASQNHKYGHRQLISTRNDILAYLTVYNDTVGLIEAMVVFHPRHIEVSGELWQDMRLCRSLPGELKTGGPGPPKEILGTDSSLEVLNRQGATLDRGDSFSGCSDAVLNLHPVKDTHREITPGFDNHVSLPSKLEVINNPSPSLSRRLAEPVKNFQQRATILPKRDQA